MSRLNFLILLLGAASLLPYLAALGLGDLRENTIGFEVAFGAAFALYLAAVSLVLRPRRPSLDPSVPVSAQSQWTLVLIFVAAILFRLLLLPGRPTLSDDMYRYVWDGRVQAHGINPYRYPPDADRLADLRRGGRTLYRYINRKEFVTVYPPGAQVAFAGVWRAVGDNVTGFKTAFVIAELSGGVLLLWLLRIWGQPQERVLIYLWSPLLVFEVAHAGHVDGLLLPLLILAFWARAAERPWLLGLSLGAATLIKLFPGLLLPALLPLAFNRSGVTRVVKCLLGFAGLVALGYLLYWRAEASALGFLPHYFGENFNLGLARLLFDLARRWSMSGSTLANAVTFGGLGALSLAFLAQPAGTPRAALLRCVWLIGWFTLFSQNLFPWYLLWLLPLLALFVEPGTLLGLKLAPLSAWLIFSGTIAFSYMFFVRWRVVPWAQAAEFGPLYALLLASIVARFRPALARWPKFIAPQRRAT